MMSDPFSMYLIKMIAGSKRYLGTNPFCARSRTNDANLQVLGSYIDTLLDVRGQW